MCQELEVNKVVILLWWPPGWCSVFPERTTDRYSLPCQQLQEGDVCLPPYHPETTQTPIPVVTPDLTDAMKRCDSWP